MSSERSFKKTMNKIGVAMIVFMVLINALVFIQSSISSVLEKALPYEMAYTVSQLLYGFVYLASFIIPGIILYAMMGKERRHIMLEKKLPSGRDTAAYIVASIAMVLTMAVINAKFVSVFNYSEYSAEFLWGNDPLEPYQIVLSFITLSIVPAICEEFLFRGAVLSALKPYGKAPAIVISAVLFGLMHQNIEQLLYATAAGLVLALVVYETGSIWCGILIHFYNNFLSVFETAIFERFPENVSYPIIYILEGLIFIFGLISAVYLIVKHSNRKKSEASILADGIYGRSMADINCDNTLPEKPLSFNRTAKLFFSPTIIVFIVLSVLTMLLNILLSLLYSALGGLMA